MNSRPVLSNLYVSIPSLMAAEGIRKLTHPKTAAATGDGVSKAIVFTTSGIAALRQFSAIFFGDLLYIYYAFLISVMFAFSCAFSAIFLLHTKPNAARVFKLSGILFFSSALILLLYAVFYNYNYYFN